MCVFFGDSYLLRFYEFLGSPNQIECLATESSRLEDIRGAVENYSGSAEIAVLMGGSNNLLRLGVHDNKRRTRRTLGQKLLNIVSLLEGQFEEVYVYTLPPIPKLESDFGICWIVDRLNSMIRKLRVWYEPTDVLKAHKPFSNRHIARPNFISPNEEELARIFQTLYPGSPGSNRSGLDALTYQTLKVAEEVDYVILTIGKNGVVVAGKGGSAIPMFHPGRPYCPPKSHITHHHYPARVVKSSHIVNSSGAGDCFASGFIAAMLTGKPEAECVEAGFRCAKASLKSSSPVPKKFEF